MLNMQSLAKTYTQIKFLFDTNFNILTNVCGINT